MKAHRPWLPIVIAVLMTLPGIIVRFGHLPLSVPLITLLSGIAILGASFLLLWACDVAQLDISQTLALAVVALIAVLPEYAVDMYFTWTAATKPEYAHYAIANMTGANRLLIGVAWVVIVAIFWFKTRQPVTIEKDRRTELIFLGMATAYAFIIPLKGSLTWYDGIIFLGLYIWYIIIAGKRPCEECEVEGPAELLANMPAAKRRLSTICMFLFAAGAILFNAEPFSHGLVETGKLFQINEFLLVQWLAPIASEAPEFIVAIMFATRAKAGLALGSLLSAKLNQWTLLVGMIPWVYALASGQLSSHMPMDSIQMGEILLTAAQSLLAVIMLSTLRLSISQAILLLSLFLGQLFMPTVVEWFPRLAIFGMHGDQIHMLFSAFYLVAAVTIFLEKPDRLNELWRGLQGYKACELTKEPDASQQSAVTAVER